MREIIVKGDTVPDEYIREAVDTILGALTNLRARLDRAADGAHAAPAGPAQARLGICDTGMNPLDVAHHGLHADTGRCTAWNPAPAPAPAADRVAALEALAKIEHYGSDACCFPWDAFETVRAALAAQMEARE